MNVPWSNSETLQTEDGLTRLSKEILDFERYISPTKNEKLNRDTLFYSVTRSIDSLWPNTKINAFGSYVTGLQFPSSDVDININFEVLPRNTKSDALKLIRRKLAAEGIFENRRMKVVANAKVPVLMATDNNAISMDITIQNDCLSSHRTTVWIIEYPALKPLFMVLKQSISAYRVSNLPAFEPLSAKTAGLASYSLICLIVSYLQLQVDPNLSSSDANYYGILLMGFLDFYSNFKNEEQAISLTNGGSYLTGDNCPIRFEPKNGKLFIVDPDVKGANVARSTLRFDVIKLIFKQMLKDLREHIAKSSNNESILSSIIKLAQSHYYGKPRNEGTKFKVKHMWIEAGKPKLKRFRKNNRYHDGSVIHRAGEGHVHNYSRDRRNENYKNSYKNRSFANADDEQLYYNPEYQRHLRHNRPHLAEHYKKKANKHRK